MVKLLISDYLRKKIVNYVLRGIDFSSLPKVYLGLFTTIPNDEGGTEVSGGSYSRSTLTKAFAVVEDGLTKNT